MIGIFFFTRSSHDMKQANDWFSSWFDSPYYALLYRDRNDSEAEHFIRLLVENLQLEDRSRILDLACGKGRHSIQLQKMGFRVVGVDLSANSIASAKHFENADLHFLRDDMRHFDLGMQFDCVVNLFTSFGYFNDSSDNELVLANVKRHLKPNGLFVMDFFNEKKVRSSLVPFAEKELDGVRFELRKRIEDGFVKKQIKIHADQHVLEFEEKVQLLSPEQIVGWVEKAGLKVIRTFGSYDLEPFHELQSDRFILIAQ